MNNDLKIVMEHFDRAGMTYRQLDDEPVLRLTFGMNNGTFDSLFAVSHEPRSLEFVALFPVTVPEAKRPQVTELLHRVNQSTRISYLRMDIDKGRVSSKTAIMLGCESVLDEEMIRHLVLGNLLLADEYLLTVQKVVFGNVEPKDALNAPAPNVEASSQNSAESHLGGRLRGFFEASDN